MPNTNGVSKEANRADDIGTSESKPPVDPLKVKIDEYGNTLDGTPLDESKKQMKAGVQDVKNRRS